MCVHCKFEDPPIILPKLRPFVEPRPVPGNTLESWHQFLVRVGRKRAGADWYHKWHSLDREMMRPAPPRREGKAERAEARARRRARRYHRKYAHLVYDVADEARRGAR